MMHTRNWKGSTALAGAASSKIIRANAGYVRDNFVTFDQATMDSAGAFLVGELERLDPMIHLPLASVTWQRDIDLRTDVQMGDELSSFTQSSFGSAGGATGNGINWASKDTTTIARTTIDIAKIAAPLNLVTYEVAYTIPELKSAELTGRPIDSQMIAGMTLKHQMDTDQIVYIGDANVTLSSGSQLSGLCNSPYVTNLLTAAATGTGGLTTFISKTPQQILTDFNTMLISAWAATGYSVIPDTILIAPVPFGYLATTPMVIGTTGVSESILSYIKKNNVLTAEKDVEINFQSVKWLAAANRAGATSDRMIAYTKKQDFVRFPMVPLQAVQPQFRGIWVAAPYYGRLGQVEVVYPETIAYMDGIN